jgi:hypothetical protein
MKKRVVNYLYLLGRSSHLIICSLALGMLVSTHSLGGIKDWDAFFETCPTDDPIFEKLASDFALMINEEWIDPFSLTCTSPVSEIPIDDWNDALIIYQTFRFIYHMDFGKTDYLPWTSLSLYDWMRQGVDGVHLKDGVSGGYCCDRIEGKRLIVAGTSDELGREFRRSNAREIILFHERRHADPDAPRHSEDCCEYSPGCDQKYDLENLGAYGVTKWISEQYASREIDFGGCNVDLNQFLINNANWANNINGKICDSSPEDVVANLDGPECGSGEIKSRPTISGMWYDQKLDGEGFNFIIDESRFIVIYYGYSVIGERLWLISEIFGGEIQAGKTITLMMSEFIGGTFDLPKPGKEANVYWGSVTIQFNDCSSGNAQLFGIDGEKMSDIVPIITAGASCEMGVLTN